MVSDVRYALRLLRKSRLFTLTVVSIIAVGIGATTAIFSVVHAVLLRPLPFADPGRLMQVAEKNDALHLPSFAASALNYLSWKEATRSFDSLGAMQFATFTLSGRREPENYTGNAVSPSLMPLLGLTPVAGRAFTPDEDRVGGAAVAMISESLWRRRFGADPGVVGQAVSLNGVSSTLVGVAPRALTTLTNGDVFIPLVIDPAKEIRLNHVLIVVGRLKDGVTPRAAQAEMTAIATAVGRQYPEVKDWGINLITFTDTFVSPQMRTGLLVLLGAVVFLLVIVSANVANLLLARARDRQKEMAVRVALGAARSRLLVQLLIESVVLSGLGGVLGMLLATWAVALLESTLPPNTLPVPDVGVDRAVLVRRRRDGAHRHRLRAGTGVACRQDGRECVPEGRRPLRDRRRASAVAQGTRRGGARARHGAPGGRRAPGAVPGCTAARAARVQSGRRHHDAGVAAADTL